MTNSVCIRCGKMRVVSKTWKEKINGSVVSFSLSVCPDPDCQKLVEREFALKEKKTKELERLSLERKAQARKKTTLANKARKKAK